MNASENPHWGCHGEPMPGFIKSKVWKRTVWVWAGLVLWASACDFKMPAPPPDVFYKFNTIKVGRGPAFVVTADLNQDDQLDLITANSKNHT